MLAVIGVSAGLAAIVSAGACLPHRPEGDVTRLPDREDAGLDGGGIVFQDGGGGNGGGQDTDPHSLAAVQPSHGGFEGGTHVLVQGTGFSFQPRVFFGGVEVPSSSIVAVSSKKIQVTTPPGMPGTVDVTVQNGDDASTARTLPSAFTYDAFYVDPSEGPTSGGTHVTLHGSGTHWSGSPMATVSIGGADCPVSGTPDDTTIACTVAASTPGAKPVTVTAPDGSTITVADAFTYADSDNGFRGGTAGNPLAGTLRVLAFDSYTGDPLSGAAVILGTAVDKPYFLGDTGVIAITDPSLNAPVTVTVARKCSQPTTFVNVPVDTVTMYLDPVMSPECASMGGMIPPVGGTPSMPSGISGEILFPQDQEFHRGAWTFVPMAGPNERRVAYIFAASSDPKSTFTLPDPSLGVTEASTGTNGYAFTIPAPTGNVTVYALVGIETTTGPRTFTAYAFGSLSGVGTMPGATTTDAYIPISTPLDQAVTVHLEPPPPSSKGPDRVVTSVAVTLGAGQYAIFPNGQRTSFLPVQGDVSFVGLPELVASLGGQSYVVTAQGGTGPQLSMPKAVVGKIATKDASEAITIDGFVAIPTLPTPASGATWDGSSFVVGLAKGGFAPDLLVLDVSSGGGLVDWTIAAPASAPSFSVPDLRKLAGGGGLVPGPIDVTVVAATIPSFNYGLLRYIDLDSRGWSAYSENVFYAELPP